MKYIRLVGGLLFFVDTQRKGSFPTCWLEAWRLHYVISGVGAQPELGYNESLFWERQKLEISAHSTSMK